jgi:hypothetical protein
MIRRAEITLTPALSRGTGGGKERGFAPGIWEEKPRMYIRGSGCVRTRTRY